MIILVDQDGVIADFDGYFITKWEKTYPEIVLPDILNRNTFDIDKWVGKELQEKADNLPRNPEYFINLPPIKGAIEGINKLKDAGHDVFICTSPLKTYEHCVLEKYLWVEKHLGKEWTQKVILTRDKTLIHGDILIDDKAEVKGIKTPSWEHILFDQSYNKHIENKRRMTWENISEVKDLFEV